MDRRQTLRVLACLVLAATASCGPRTDPATLLPADADAVAVVRPAVEVARRVAPLLDALPEAAGAIELLRSLGGLDLRTPDRTRAEGLDPERPLAVAWWRGALLVLAPVVDEATAMRRLALRLARLGYVELPGGAGPRTFRRPDVEPKGPVATLRGVRDVAVLCAGPAATCVEATFPTPGAGWNASEAAREVALPDADVAGRVSGGWIASQVPALLGVPKSQRGAVSMGLSMLGDVRWAASLDGGFRVRVAVGSTGEPADLPVDPDALEAGLALVAQLALPDAALGLAGTALRNCGAPCRLGNVDASSLLAGWTGRAVLGVPAGGPAVPGPAVSLRALADRLKAGLLVSFRTAAAAEGAVALLVPPPPAAPAPVPAPIPATAPGGRADPDPRDAAGGRIPENTMEGPWRGPEGIEGTVAAVEDRVGLVLRAANPARELAAGLRPAFASALPARAGERVLRVRIDPGALLEAAGGTGIEFLRHAVGAMRVIFVDVGAADGRVTLDAGVRLRQAGP